MRLRRKKGAQDAAQPMLQEMPTDPILSGAVTPAGGFSLSEVEEKSKLIKSDKIVLKAQIHAGGRGKGGGVKIANGIEEVEQHANEILGMNLVTHQTGLEGQKVQRLLIETASDIERELYAGIVLDRSCGKFVFMVSTEGGVEIEKVSAETPEKIVKEWIAPNEDLKPYQARKLAFALQLTGTQVKNAVKTFLSLWKVFKLYDCSLMEINPLVVTEDHQVLALDAKFGIDDNALYRRPDTKAFRDLDEEDPSEIEASKHGLNYIALDGNIGCLVNGAGLAMATMDIIKFYGAEPANFLDVGGGASDEQVAQAFRVLLENDKLRAILVNIFGGIMRCDVVAQGLVNTARTVDLLVPLVVRLEGTNVEQGREILANSGLNMIVANTMDEAAKQVVQAAA